MSLQVDVGVQVVPWSSHPTLHCRRLHSFQNAGHISLTATSNIPEIDFGGFGFGDIGEVRGGVEFLLKKEAV